MILIELGLAKRTSTFILLVLFNLGFCFSQQRIERISDFDAFYVNPTFVSPASTINLNRARADFFIRSYRGDFSEVQEQALAFSFQPKRNEIKSTQHEMGLWINSQQEGPHIKNTRVYGNYKLCIPVSKNWRVGAGIDVGYMNAILGATGRSSDFTFVSNLGITAYSKQFHISGSIQHLLDQELVPLQSRIQLPRTFNIAFGYELDLSEKLVLKTDWWTRIIPMYYKQQVINLRMSYKKRVVVGISTGAVFNKSHQTNIFVSPQVGLTEIPIKSALFDVFFTYRFPVLAVASNNTFDLVLAYRLN